MGPEDLEAWIEYRYGPIKLTAAGGVCVAAVAVMDGIAMGFGALPSHAIYDLHCDLCVPSSRCTWNGLSFPAAELAEWQTSRRADIDRERRREDSGWR